MARIKMKLPTGMDVEKPVVTCFEVENNTYLILDAENIGSMGLPIILVCKIENGTVKKIVDSAEWQKAKDYLKGIIAGNSMNYVSISSEVPADEVYYTQLTLPVASFDVIKNAYKVDEPIAPVEEPIVTEPAPVMPEIPVEPVAPVIEDPMPANPVPTDPIIPETPVVEVATPVAPTDPVIPVEPVVSEEISGANDIDFAASKEAFMKACENMYDALVAKFQAQLDSKNKKQ